MKPNHFARKKRQLSSIVSEIYSIQKNGSSNTSLMLQKLHNKLQNLVKELRNFLTKNELKKALGSLAFILGFSVINPSFSQSFQPPVANPYGLTSGIYNAIPTIADIDGDGDLDVLIGDYLETGLFQYYENIGSASSPEFAARVTNPFGLDATVYFVYPTFGDLDSDGDIDLLSANIDGELYYYKNIGTPSDPEFDEPVTTPFGLIPLGSDIPMFPELVDIDNDGDLDLFIGVSTIEDYINFSQMSYFENIGTAIAPIFDAPQTDPFGFISENFGSQFCPTFGDLDNDGDFDLLGGEFGGLFRYYENTGNASNPTFGTSVTNPFDLIATDNLAFPALADMDADGDLDILAGEYPPDLVYFENDGNVGFNDLDAISTISFYPNPVKENLNIFTDELIESIEIFDVTGKLVFQTKSTTVVNLKDLSSGIYSTTINLSSGKIVVKKIIKK